MQIDHIAVYVQDLERAREFYTRYFAGRSNGGYHNPKTGLRTYFITFAGGCRLELMSRPSLGGRAGEADPAGYDHLSFRLESREAVDALTGRLSRDGYTVCGGPRVTGDGYYESCVLDGEGNRIELVG